MPELQLKLIRNAIENIVEFEDFLSVTWIIYHLQPQGGPRMVPHWVWEEGISISGYTLRK